MMLSGWLLLLKTQLAAPWRLGLFLCDLGPEYNASGHTVGAESVVVYGIEEIQLQPICVSVAVSPPLMICANWRSFPVCPHSRDTIPT